jgi:hypothetical protein
VAWLARLLHPRIAAQVVVLRRLLAALEQFERAITFSPLDPFAVNTRLAMACSDRPEEAVAMAKDVTKKIVT